jgi:hypothetical protein
MLGCKPKHFEYTTFSKLTDLWRDAQFGGAKKGKQVGNGPEEIKP